MSAVDGRMLPRKVDTPLTKFLRRHRLTFLWPILCRRFTHNIMVYKLCETRKTELIEWQNIFGDSKTQKSGDIQLRSKLLYLFQRDLLCSGPHKAVLDIVTKAEEEVFSRRTNPAYPPSYSKYSMYGWIYLVIVHVCMLTYIIVNGFYQSLEYQYAALATLTSWTLVDLLVVSTISAVLMHCVAPLYIMHYVYRATDRCYQHFSGCQNISDGDTCEKEDNNVLILPENFNNGEVDEGGLGSVISLYDAGAEEKSGQNGTSNSALKSSDGNGDDNGSDGDRKWTLMDTVYDFNALQYYFVSGRCAIQCSHLRESKIVSDLSSLFLDDGSNAASEFYSRSNKYMYVWTSARQGWLHNIAKQVFSSLETAGLGCWIWWRSHVSPVIGEMLAEVVSIIAAFFVLILHLQLGLGLGVRMFVVHNVPFSLLVFVPALAVIVLICIAVCIDLYCTRKWLRYRSDLYRFGLLHSRESFSDCYYNICILNRSGVHAILLQKDKKKAQSFVRQSIRIVQQHFRKRFLTCSLFCVNMF